MNKNSIMDIVRRSNVDVSSVCGKADHVAFFEPARSVVCVMPAMDFEKGNFENVMTVRRVSQLGRLGRIAFINPEDHADAFPGSMVMQYIKAEHSKAAYENPGVFTAAYIHLYRCYKSFDTLVSNGYSVLVDAFIERAINDDIEHPGTLAYFNYQVHKVFRLRKSVYTMFRSYLNDYDAYSAILELQNRWGYSDGQFRALKKRLKDSPDFGPEVDRQKRRTKSGLELIA